MPAKKWDSYLGRARLRRLLRDPFNDFNPRAAAEFFGSEGITQRFLDAWRKLADKSGSHDWSEDIQVPFARVERLASGATAPDHDELFLVVDIAWGDGTTACYGELDRPLFDRQVLAAVLEIGDIGRQLAPDSDLQRNGFAITFADPEGEIAARVADGSWLGAKVKVQIGHSRFAEEFWQKWGTWRIDRPTGQSPTTCTLSLEDAGDELLEEEIRLASFSQITQNDFGEPTEFGDLVRGKILHASTQRWISKNRSFHDLRNGPDDFPGRDEDALKARIPLPIGDDVYKPPFAWVNPLVSTMATDGFAPLEEDNPLMIVVLGASKNPGWETSRYLYAPTGDVPLLAPEMRDWEIWYAGTHPNSAAYEWDVKKGAEPWTSFLPGLGAGSNFPFRTGSDHGLVPWLEVFPVRGAGANPTDLKPSATWYVAVLFFCYFNDPITPLGLAAAGHEFNKTLGRTLKDMRAALQDGKLFVRTPGYGAEGKASSRARDHNAGAAIRYLLEHHTAIPRLDFEGGFLTSLTSLQDAPGMEPVGGTITEDSSAGENIGAICRTWGCDVFISRYGKLGFALPDLSPEDRAYLQKYVLTYDDEYDIIRGSFAQQQLVGNDRLGQASVLQITGLKEHSKIKSPFLADAPAFDNRGEAVTALGGRRIDKKIDISWLPQSVTVGIEGQLAQISDRALAARCGVRVELPLSAGEDLAGWMNIAHGQWMTEEGREDTTRTCRVVGIALRWKNRTIAYDLVDEHDFAVGTKDYILDDEALWTLAGTRRDGDGLGGKPSSTSGARVLTFQAGNDIVLTNFDPTTILPRGLLVGDILHAWGSANAGNKGPFRITAVTTTTIKIDTLASTNEPLNSLLWEIQCSHETRPDWQVRPTQYGNPADAADGRLPSSAYGALADDDVLGPTGEPGAFSTIDDGYQL